VIVEFASQFSINDVECNQNMNLIGNPPEKKSQTQRRLQPHGPVFMPVAKWTVPSEGKISPAIIDKRVDFPAPFSPKIVILDPSRIAKSTQSKMRFEVDPLVVFVS
jgi:hypothetical protein